MKVSARVIAAVVIWPLLAVGAEAAPCPAYGTFDNWLGSVRKEAEAKGIAKTAIDAGLANVTLDQDVLSRDRGQGVFQHTFEQFSTRMVNPRLSRAKQMMLKYASILDRIETQFGVPGSVLVAIWGMETDFGAVNGSFPTIRALATLAYDCRRTDMFRAELFDALRLVQRGDLQPAQMKGAWAGELGQTQFMPSSYLKYAVDFGGGRDLIHSAPDVLASTANFLKNNGWQKGQPWDPGKPNFAAIQQWNKADVYARTIALFADKLNGS